MTMTVKKETAQIRPFVVCAILRNVPRALVLAVFWKRFFLGRRLGPGWGISVEGWNSPRPETVGKSCWCTFFETQGGKIKVIWGTSTQKIWTLFPPTKKRHGQNDATSLHKKPKVTFDKDRYVTWSKDGGDGCQTPRERSPPSYPPKLGSFTRAGRTSTANI